MGMSRTRAGKVNLSVLASLLASLASVGAVVTAGLVARHVQEESRLFRESVRVELLWHLTDRWNSAEMGDIRGAAAAALLNGNATTEVGAILNFFEQTGSLIERGVLDEESVARYFYWPLANYWAACTTYAPQIQQDDPTTWKSIPGLVQRLGDIEARRKRQGEKRVAPSVEETKQFLRDEQAERECGDDTDAQKTPA
ncbi:MAG: hypothetical protein H6Q33_37 [Deltaproteobacteria bacterium]|nr:hypothetical protein [Deltaproteobacteria bacterium]